MKKLIITEKPSVAKDFGVALGNPVRNDGYITSGDYNITWAFGHLFEFDDSPYNNGAWSIEALPILPDRFGYRPVEDKKKQIAVIKNLLKEADTLIIAGDAGREGELIQREILINCGFEKHPNAFRFWTSEALTPEVIRKCLTNLKPLKDYDSLYYSALARSVSDWIVGINFSRLFSVLGNSRWTLGRVQTPTLSIIVSRDEAIKNFKPEEFYIITATFGKFSHTFQGKLIMGSDAAEDENNDGERLNEQASREIIENIKDYTSAIVSNIRTDKKKKNPPPLFSLTSLQRTANRLFGYSAQQTLTIAQNLYETHKCISYPRTDCQHLAESSKELAESKLQLFRGNLDADVNRPNKRVFDSSKLTDHHAIIPFAKLNSTNPEEINIYNLILNAFLAAFMPEYVYESTIYQMKVSRYTFQANGRKEIQKGWKEIYEDTSSKEDGEDSDIILPFLSVNDQLTFADPTRTQKWTTPPKKMTEESILGIMEKIEQYGLGTPATRASIIEKIISTGYVYRDKKNLVATEKGIELIRTLDGCQVKEAKMTSEWEEKLDLIYKNSSGFNGYTAFIGEIKSFVTGEITKYKGADIKRTHDASPKMLELARKLAKERSIKDFDKTRTDFDYINKFIKETLENPQEVKCPCGNGTLKQSPKAWTCSCERTIWKELFGKKLTESQIMKLFAGETIEVKDMVSKTKGKFTAKARYSPENKRVDLVFENKK